MNVTNEYKWTKGKITTAQAISCFKYSKLVFIVLKPAIFWKRSSFSKHWRFSSVSRLKEKNYFYKHQKEILSKYVI